MVSSGNPSNPYFFAILLESTVPVVRFTFLIGRSSWTFSPFSMAGLQSSTGVLSRMQSSPWSCFCTQYRATSGATSGMVNSGVRSSPSPSSD